MTKPDAGLGNPRFSHPAGLAGFHRDWRILPHGRRAANENPERFVDATFNQVGVSREILHTFSLTSIPAYS